MAYDTSALDRDGALRKRLRKQLDQVEARLGVEVPRARAAGVTWSYLMTATGGALSWLQKLVERAGDTEEPGADAT